MAWRRCPSWLALAASLSYVTSAAAEPTPSELAVARTRFREAVQLEREKKWPEAEAKLREALAIKETPGLRYHVAVCEAEQGHLVEALVEYDRAQELIDLGNPAPDVEKLIGPARDKLRERVPTLRIEGPQLPANATLELDGQPLKVGLGGEPIPLDPGSHRVLVRAAGYLDFQKDIDLEEGAREVLQVTLEAQPAAAPPAPQPKPPPPASPAPADTGSSAQPRVLAAEGAVFAGGLVMGIVFQLDSNDAGQSADDAERFLAINLAEVPRNSRCSEGAALRAGFDAASQQAVDSVCAQIPEFRDTEDSSQTLAYVGYGIAGAGLVAGILTWLLWPDSSPEAGAVARPELRVHASPDAAGASVGLRF